jgi:hypothetical protein
VGCHLTLFSVYKEAPTYTIVVGQLLADTPGHLKYPSYS